MKHHIFIVKILLVITTFILVLASQANAGTLEFELDVEFSGGAMPSGTLTAVIDDSFGAANTVRLTMDATGLSGTEGVRQWYFNFDPAETASSYSLTFHHVSGAQAKKIVIRQNNCKADGDGFYDFKFIFNDEPNGLGPDSDDITSVYDITYTSVITVSSFNFLSVPGGGNGQYLSAAQVIDIGGDDINTGWVGDAFEDDSD